MLQTLRALSRQWNRNLFLLSPFGLFMIVAVILLLVTAFITGGRSNKGGRSLEDLRAHLKDLLAALNGNRRFDAEKERALLEQLLNRVKVSCAESAIRENEPLKDLVEETCTQIQRITQTKETGERTTWLQLKQAVYGFQDQYFPKAPAVLAH